MTRYPYLLFDADNTLFDFDEANVSSFRAVCAYAGLAFTPELFACFDRRNSAAVEARPRGAVTAKPAVEYFDYVFAHIDGITRENCLVIGDSLTSDIQGANNYGLACCWFNPKKAPKPESLRVDYEIRDLRELYDIVK